MRLAMVGGGLADAHRMMTLSRLRFFASLGLVAAALLLGGGPDPFRAMLIEFVAVAVLVAMAVETPPKRPALPMALALAFILLVALTPLVQLVPLPAGLWHDLPGRDVAAAIAGLVGAGARARPLSIDPEATLAGALGLIAPIAMFLATARARPAERGGLAAALLLGAIASATLGAFQVASGGRFLLYETTHSHNAIGFFANRNHEADLLMVGMLTGTAVLATRYRGRRGIAILAVALILILGLGVLTTTSRMGLLLLPLAVAGSLAVAFRRSAGLVAAVFVLLAVTAALLLTFNGVAHEALLRFSLSDVERMTFWNGTLVAIRQYWPLGAGVGAFVPAYAAVEVLETIDPAYVNHAHNDYLELLLEMGAWAVVLVVGYVLLLVRQAATSRAPGAMRIAAFVAIAILMLHSTVDYPLRTVSLATVFGLLNGLLMPERMVNETDTDDVVSKTNRRRVRRSSVS